MEKEFPLGRITSAEQNFIRKLDESHGVDMEGALSCLVKEYQDIHKQPSAMEQYRLLQEMDERIERELKIEKKSFSVDLACNDPQIKGGRKGQLSLVVLNGEGEHDKKSFVDGSTYELNYDTGALTKVETICEVARDVEMVPSELAENISKHIASGSLENSLPQLRDLVKSIVSPALPQKKSLNYTSASAEINDALFMVNTLLKRSHSNYSLEFRCEVPGELNGRGVHTGDKPFSLNGRFQLRENFPHGANCEDDVLFHHLVKEVHLSADLKSKDFHLAKPF